MSAGHRRSHTLIVFGGSIHDAALATDFVMISKKLIADGLAPTCLSGTNIYDITSMTGPFLFGRDDLRQRTQIYDSTEAQNPFYRLAGAEGLKQHIMAWIQNVSSLVRHGDRIIIVLIGHGVQATQPTSESTSVLLRSRRGAETLTKTEVTASLLVLPRHVRVLLVNEACYSGSWATIAPDVGVDWGVLVETAASIGEQSYNYRSGSGRYRCSMFAAAYIEELTTHPEGRISQHRARIREEMQYVAPDKEISTPLAIPSARSLLSYNISHFIMTPNIANAIMDIASDQDRHEAFPRSRASARSFWARIRPTPSGGPGHANAGDASDMRISVMQSYLDDLGLRAAEQNRCTLATACQLALDGRVGDEMIDRIVRTIAWQEAMMLRVGGLLEHLASNGLISHFFDAETARDALVDRTEASPLAGRFDDIPEIEELQGPWGNDDRYVDAYFFDAHVWLLRALECNRLLRPSAFDVDQIIAAIVEFLRNSPVE